MTQGNPTISRPVSTTYTNIHGRRPGRGIRPWLLLPKIVAIAMYVGGLAVVTLLWWMWGAAAVRSSDARRELLLDLTGLMMTRFVVPALLAAMVLGALLLLRHPRQFLRMRWLQVKLVLLVMLIPAGHFWCRAQALVLQDVTAAIDAHARAARGLTLGLTGTLAGSLAIMVLGRLKPRLGQRYGQRE